MDPNRKNNDLLVRALGQNAGEPGSDLTQRVMQRIEEECAMKNRRENRRQFIAAVCCELVFVAVGIWAFWQLPDVKIGSLLRATFLNPDNGFLIGTYCFAAVLFFVFSAVGHLLCRKFSEAALK